MIGLYPIVGDLLHAGHILAIKEAKENCDYLIVALNCTPENKSPVQSIYERFTQLKAIKYIDEVIPYQGKEDLENIIKSLNYQIRFIGEDYYERDWDGKEIEKSLNKNFHYLKRKHGFSSTALKYRIIKKNELLQKR